MYGIIGSVSVPLSTNTRRFLQGIRTSDSLLKICKNSKNLWTSGTPGLFKAMHFGKHRGSCLLHLLSSTARAANNSLESRVGASFSVSPRHDAVPVDWAACDCEILWTYGVNTSFWICVDTVDSPIVGK